MPRTRPTAVQSILQNEYDLENRPALEGFIDTASMMVDEIVVEDTALKMTATRLELVERWLAAHFYQISDPGYQSRTTAGASGSFTGQTSQTFKATRYGQQALALDLTGFLERRDKEVEEGARRRVQLFVL